jgi:tRNA(Ile)-lysidine synthase
MLSDKQVTDLLATYKKIFIAYSGGIDSHVLLHLIVNWQYCKKNIKLFAVHINHNISPNSHQWQLHCRRTCYKLGITYITKTIPRNLTNNISSPEETLRNLRYKIFAKILPSNACLLTAHQADDQAETLLLQLFRGTGIKGLAAMPEKIKFAEGFLVRPLLKQKREDILCYANRHKLEWIEDESNTDIGLTRNFIRYKLFPIIRKKWSSIVTTLNRVSLHCAEANELLSLLGRTDLKKILRQPNIINTFLLKKLSIIRQKNVLRLWLHQLNLPLPSSAKLSEIIRTVVNSRYDKTPIVKWSGAEVRRFRHNLYAMTPLSQHDNKVILFFSKKTLKLPSNLGNLKVKLTPKTKLRLEKIKVGFRRGGEKIKIPGRIGSHNLKKLMQEWEIPPWLRDRTPLIYNNKTIIAVVGYYSIEGVHFTQSIYH